MRFSRNQRRRRCLRPPFISAEGTMLWSRIPGARGCRVWQNLCAGWGAQVLAVSDLSHLHFVHGPRHASTLGGLSVSQSSLRPPPVLHPAYPLTAAPYRKLRPLRLTIAPAAASYAGRPACARAHGLDCGVLEIMYIDWPHRDAGRRLYCIQKFPRNSS